MRTAIRERLETLTDPVEGVTFQQVAEGMLVNDILAFHSRLLESKEQMKNDVIDELLPWVQAQVEPGSSAKEALIAISDFKKVKWNVFEKFKSLDEQKF
ncbi:hypothetical protein I7V28_19620 [Lelliottia amnigena]|uniref:hypothetical protein n=1 Tax=Lelliottia TaxID=1330545 RepID=UPI00192BED16|nr:MULTISPECIES: hypothetical protein [Lelliottia]MBL5885712.1 hypothetical protein [Lelliottia aquatilis]MBL5923291.1 hypothetical protein [Lelliottia amnigena]MBL5932200.1 hypothetical protein [Lelliottia amnigena]